MEVKEAQVTMEVEATTDPKHLTPPLISSSRPPNQLCAPNNYRKKTSSLTMRWTSLLVNKRKTANAERLYRHAPYEVTRKVATRLPITTI